MIKADWQLLVKQLRTHWEKIFLALLISIIVLQVLRVTQNISWVIDSEPIISAMDDDAGAIIRKTNVTRWYNDNGWSHYGSTYFRIAHTWHFLFPDAVNTENENLRDTLGKSAHFIVLLLALFSLLGICYLLAIQLTTHRPSQAAVVAALFAAFTYNPIWSTFVVRAHPDLPFAFMVLLSLILTAKMLDQTKENKYFLASALLWGLTLNTKLTLVLFAPGFVLLFVPPFVKASIVKGARYLFWILVSFLIVGFPQSFSLGRAVKFLSRQSKYSVSPDWDSFLEWAGMFKEQMLLPVLVLILVYLFVPEKPVSRWRRGTLIRISVFVFLALAMMVSRKMILYYQHYPIPFVVMLCALLCWVLPKQDWFKKQARYLQFAFPILLIIGVRLSIGLVPAEMNNSVRGLRTCRQEAKALYQTINDMIAKGGRILVDPMVPYDKFFEPQVNKSWERTLQHITEHNANFLVLSNFYYSRFFTQTIIQNVRNKHPSWPEQVAFYENFSGKNEARIKSLNQTWKLLKRDECHWEIWALK